MNALERRLIGRTGIEVTRLGLGTGPLGGLFVDVPDDEAAATVRTAIAAGINFFDTAPYYGLGLSEHRVGDELRRLPESARVLATKAGRVLRGMPRGGPRRQGAWVGGLEFDPVFDYSYDGILRSFEDSQQRLGISTIDMLAIHDLDVKMLGSREEFERRLDELHSRGGARALRELRDAGSVRAVGLGINACGAIPRVIDVIDLDYVILAMPYTLLDQEALDEELPLCEQRGISVIIGAVYASGILASAPGGGTYGYSEASEDVVGRVDDMRAVCERHGVSLAAAALQFPLAHPAVAAVIPGAISPIHVRENVERFRVPIPFELWKEMKDERLLRPDAPVPS